MLTTKVQAALNQQINAELGSAYLYLGMAAHFEAANLPGSAAWMRRQAGEEVEHAMKIFDYVNDRDGRVVLEPVAAPPTEYGSAVEVWQAALAHEQKVTGLIHRLYELATAEKDHATATMLNWFIQEQVEEEATARAILEEVQRIGPSSSALYFVDRHLGKRAEKEGE